MFCKKCGSNITQGSSFCTKCGHPVNKVPQQAPQYSNQYFNPYQQMPRRGGIPGIVIFLGIAVIIFIIIIVAVNEGSLDKRIIGRWQEDALFLGSQYEFRANNTGTFTGAGVVPVDFTWSLDGDRIILRYAYGWTSTYTISIDGNTLTFRDGTIQGVHRYTRVR